MPTRKFPYLINSSQAEARQRNFLRSEPHFMRGKRGGGEEEGEAFIMHSLRHTVQPVTDAISVVRMTMLMGKD